MKDQMANEMSCRELVELVTEYLEGTLPASERARFDAHLKGCDGCRNYIDELRTAIRMVGRLTEESLSPGAEAALLATFRRWKIEENGRQ
jgi:anti-sigma factor RsiW